jgi:hypothetical protein
MSVWEPLEKIGKGVKPRQLTDRKQLEKGFNINNKSGNIRSLTIKQTVTNCS